MEEEYQQVFTKVFINASSSPFHPDCSSIQNGFDSLLSGSRTQRSTNHRQHFTSSRLSGVGFFSCKNWCTARLLQLASEIEIQKATISFSTLYTPKPPPWRPKTTKLLLFSSSSKSFTSVSSHVFPHRAPIRQKRKVRHDFPKHLPETSWAPPNGVQIEQALGQVYSFQT